MLRLPQDPLFCFPGLVAGVALRAMGRNSPSLLPAAGDLPLLEGCKCPGQDCPPARGGGNQTSPLLKGCAVKGRDSSGAVRAGGRRE